MGDFFKGIGNFFGGIFGDNREEEERKKATQAQSPSPAPTPAPSRPRQQAPTVPNLGGLSLPSINQNKPLQVAKQQAQQDEFEGLSDEDRNTASRLKSEGRQYQGFVDAARNEKQAMDKHKSDTSILGATGNAMGAIGRMITDPFIQMGEQSKAIGDLNRLKQEKATEKDYVTVRDNNPLVSQAGDMGLTIQQPAQRVLNPQLEKQLRDEVERNIGVRPDEQALAGNTLLSALEFTPIGLAPDLVRGGKAIGRGAKSLVDNIATQAARQSDALKTKADDLLTKASQPEKQLGDVGNGISSANQAAAKRANLEQTAQVVRTQADEVVIQAQREADLIRQQEAPAPIEVAPPARQVEQTMPDTWGAADEALPPRPRPLDEAQQAIDEATLQPTPETPPARPVETSTPLQTRSTQQAQAIAESTPPVAPQRAIADIDTSTPEGMAQAQRQYVSELRANGADATTIAREVEELRNMERAVSNPVRDAVAEAETAVKGFDDVLKREGSSFGILTRKVRDAEAKNIQPDLTPIERQVYEQARPYYDDALKTLMEKKIVDVDTGYRSNYMATGRKEDIVRPNSVDDIANQDFAYARKRSNELSDKQVEEGAMEAFVDYVARGKGAKNLSNDQVDNIRSQIKFKEVEDDLLTLKPRSKNEPEVNIKLSDENNTKFREITKEQVKTERELADLENKLIRTADNPERAKAFKDEIVQVQDKAIKNSADRFKLLADSVEGEIKAIRASNLSRTQKQSQVIRLQDHLRDVRQKMGYEQTFVKTNVLTQLAGRTADQIAKGVQSSLDAATGIVSDPVANKAFRDAVGRSLLANRKTTKGVVKLINPNGKLYQRNIDNAISKALGSHYNRIGTKLTNLGSREKVPFEKATAYFISQADAEGIKGTKDLAAYVGNKLGTKEWERVHGMLYEMNNKFSGVGGYRGSNNPRGVLDKIVQLPGRGAEAVVNAIPGIDKTPKLRANLTDALRIGVVGFPQVVKNIGVKGLDSATFGASNFVKAKNIKVVDDATAFQKALLIKEGVDTAIQGAGAGVALGVLAGANGMMNDDYQLDLGSGFVVEPSRFMGPLAIPFTVAAAVSKGDPDPAKVLESVVGGVAKNFGTDSVAKGFELMADLTAGNWEDASRYVPSMGANIVSMFAPLSSQMNQIGNATDPSQRDTRGDKAWDSFVNGLVRKVPGLREQLPAQLDKFGNEIESNKIGSVIPVGYSPSEAGKPASKTSPVVAELDRLEKAGHSAAPKDRYDFKLKDTSGENIKLDRKQQVSLNQAVFKERERHADLIMGTDSYKNASDSDKARLLGEVYNTGRSSVASEWAKENGIAGVKADVSISSKIPVESQRALLEYKIQGDKKEVWLDDMTNARNYHVANYENATENGTLTEKDKSLQYKSGKRYKSVASQVDLAFGADAKLRYDYTEVSQKQLDAMADDNPLKARLLAYDKARTEAGVSRKSDDSSQPKYKQNRSGSGSGGSGRGKTTISTPSITSGGGGGSRGGGYATVKPSETAKLQVAPKRTVDSRKRISVRRGIHL